MINFNSIKNYKISKMINSLDLASCEEAISYSFKNKEILIEALTHPSLKRLDNNIKHYQRLEFLGDKVLGFIISEYLFKNLPDYDEGILSKKQSFLVSGVICLKVATSLNLDRFILTSESYEKLSSDIVNINVSQTKILQNVTESIIGAIYIDSGSQKENVEKFIIQNWMPFLKGINDDISKQDPKTTLQEWYQKYTKKVPQYTSVDFVHDGVLYFEVSLEMEGYDRIVAIHTNRKIATKIAAAKMLQTLKDKKIIQD